MKHLSIFIALMLLTIFVRAEKNGSRTLESEKPPSPLSVANDLIVRNTISKVIEKGLNKSPVDLEPNRYHILNNLEHTEDYRDKATKEVYYPINKPEDATSALTPSNAKTSNKPALYHLDRKPYYGKYLKHRSLDPLEVEGQIKVPVVYMDLDDFKATEEQLEKLQERLEKAKFFIPTPNPEFDENGEKKLYRNDPNPYYNPMSLEKEMGEKYLKQAINKVEKMLNKDEKINPTNPPVFARVDSKKIEYQNRSNAEKEDLNNNILDNYYYPTTAEEAKKKKDEEKKKEEEELEKAKAAQVPAVQNDAPADQNQAPVVQNDAPADRNTRKTENLDKENASLNKNAAKKSSVASNTSVVSAVKEDNSSKNKDVTNKQEVNNEDKDNKKSIINENDNKNSNNLRKN